MDRRSEPITSVAPIAPGDRSALDRTLASWVRTGMALCALGLVVLRLGYYLEEMAGSAGVRVTLYQRLTAPVGVLHIAAGGLMIVLAARWHRRSVRALAEGEADPRRLARPVVIMVTIASLIGGLGLAADLLLAAR